MYTAGRRVHLQRVVREAYSRVGIPPMVGRVAYTRLYTSLCVSPGYIPLYASARDKPLVASARDKPLVASARVLPLYASARVLPLCASARD